MESRPVPNSSLRLKDIPPPDVDIQDIFTFALTYDGYAEVGSFEACAEIANERRHESLDDLRACLFFEQRRLRHSGWGPAEESEEMAYIRDLVRQIRERVGGVALTGGNSLPRQWWAALPAIPPDRESASYRRLRTVWGDQTRFRGRGIERYAEFVNPRVETNFTVTLWENFSLFPPSLWVPALAGTCGLQDQVRAVTECNWSYGWSCPTGVGRRSRIVDLIIHFRDEGGRDGIFVIEAKRPGGRLAAKDLEDSTYLDLPAVKSTSENRWLIYCVDEAEAPSLRRPGGEDDERRRVISWQRLGGLQIELARGLELPATIRGFIAGAIQYQFCEHGIRPSRLALPYLETEPSVEQMDSAAGGRGLTDLPPSEPLWRLPAR